jgi:hypothetical protein
MEAAMTRMTIARMASIAALLVSTAASAATYDYTAHYDYVGKPALPDAAIDGQLQADTETCDSTVGMQRAVPSSAYRTCMRQHGWAYRFVTRARVQAAPARDPSFSANVKLAPGHYIDHDNGMDCQDSGGVAICVPPNGTVHYFDPDQGLPCTRTGIVSICSNM